MEDVMKSVRHSAVSLIAFCLLSLGAVQAQDGHDRHVQVINNTSDTLRSFYASNVNRPMWEEDILGYRVLGPGGVVDIDIDDGTNHCFYDLKAVFANEGAVVRRNVNVCRIA